MKQLVGLTARELQRAQRRTVIEEDLRVTPHLTEVGCRLRQRGQVHVDDDAAVRAPILIAQLGRRRILETESATTDGAHRTARFFDRAGIYGEAGTDYADNAERWAFFCRAAIEVLPRLAPVPCILHAHDWHTALALVYLRSHHHGDARYDPIRTVLSVHNAGYQGHYPPSMCPTLGIPWSLFNWRRLEWYGQLNVLKGGLVFADAVVTVSPNHARELCTPGGGFGLQEVFAWLEKYVPPGGR